MAQAATGLIVLARYDSRRLPRKALKPVAGRALLGRVLDRARSVPGAPPVVVATSDRAVDDPIADYAAGEGVAVFRGAAEDVAGRCLACAREHGWVRFARISGDSPFIEPALIARLIEMHRGEGLEVATNVHPRTWPAGVSAEVIWTAILERYIRGFSAAEREHVTPFFYARAAHFRIKNLAAPDPAAYAGVRLAVDDADDLDRARWIARRLGREAATAPLDRVVALARAWASAQDVRAAS